MHPTVSSAKHWYASSVDQRKIQWVLCRIGRPGVGGGISADLDQEMDDGRSGSIARLLSFKRVRPVRSMGFVLAVPSSLGDRSIE